MVCNITEWLDQTTERFPDKTAFADENQKITFGKLRENAIALAGRLLNLGIYKEPVAIMMEKSANLVTAFFASAYSATFIR